MGRGRIALVVLALLGAGLSQAATTSRLTGTVMDTDGAALPGVTVQLWSEVLIGGRQSAITDGEGRVAFNLLPPGPYTLRAELPGFVPVELEARVALDTETQVRIGMVAQEFSGTIEVTAEAPLVDITQVGSGDSYSRDYLQNAAVGIDGRDWLAVLLQTPGALTVADEESPRGVMKGKNPQVMGSLQSENAYLLDWINVTDPLTSTFGTWLNYDAIDEVSIQKTGVDAEYGHALGGVINLVTRSGGNTFSGSADMRYRDRQLNESGVHYNPDRDASSLRAVSTTLGGPLLRDRAWFFVAFGQRLEEYTPSGSPLAQQSDRRDWIAKLTWQLSAANRLVAKASGYPVKHRNFNASSDITADAGAHRDSDVAILQAELHSVLTDSLLLAVQAGANRGYLDEGPAGGDSGQPSILNEDSGLRSGSYRDIYTSDRDRDQIQASLSYFLDDLAGRHELKAGLAVQEVENRERLELVSDGEIRVRDYRSDSSPDGTGLVDLNGDGLTDWELRREPGEASSSRSKATLLSGFLQDTWRPLAGLTVRTGVRLDEVEHRDGGGRSLADFSVWQPRLGVAWDPLGDGRQAIRASWGRSMHPGATRFSHFHDFNQYELGLMVPVHFDLYYGLEQLCQRFGWCDRETASAQFEEIETIDSDGQEHYWYLYPTTYDAPVHGTLDTLGLGRLQAPWAESLTIGVEREFGHAISLELEYVRKKTHNLIEDTLVANTWMWDSSDPDPSFDDPDTWTESSELLYVVANPAAARRDYEAVIVKAELRRERLYAKASYTWSRSHGTSFSEGWHWYSQHDFDIFPVSFYNLEGSMADDRRHVVKVSGYALLPWDTALSLAYAWASAPPLWVVADCGDVDRVGTEGLEAAGYDPVVHDYCYAGIGTYGYTVRLEPTGNRRGRVSHNLDLGIAKTFDLGEVSLELNLAILNAWGEERPERYWQREFDTAHEHGEVMEWTEPRRYQVGVRVEF